MYGRGMGYLFDMGDWRRLEFCSCLKLVFFECYLALLSSIILNTTYLDNATECMSIEDTAIMTTKLRHSELDLG
jgi:hypothetical protein